MLNPTVLPSEREFSPETVCVPLSGVMIARSFFPKVPGTKAEVLALANDMGTPNGVGANFAKLAAGMLKRYGMKGTVTEGAQAAIAAIHAAQAAGAFVAGIAGDQLNLTPHYQSNHVGHAIAVLYPLPGDPGTQLDPLAPAGYRGDQFPDPELLKFATAAIIYKVYPPDCGPAVKAATAPLNAQIAALNARIAAAKAALG